MRAQGTPYEVMSDGFRHRGYETTRLEGFVDAAFAFAVTLLVISIDAIPRTLADLVVALRDTPAFGLSFVMVAMFWTAHARWSRRYGLQDGWTTVLSLALVFLILLYVYPLKMMFATFMAWISGGWLSPGALAQASTASPAADVLGMFVIYGLMFVTLSCSLLGFYLNAWRQRAALTLDAHEHDRTGGEVFIYLWYVLVGLISVAVAAALPSDIPRSQSWLLGMPGMLYGLLSFTGVAEFVGRRWAQRRRAVATAPT